MTAKSSEKKLQINKRPKAATREELQNLNKEQLVDRVVQLQAHNFQLKNLLQKKLAADGQNVSQNTKLLQQLKEIDAKVHTEEQPDNSEVLAQRKKCKKRIFDFSKAHRRHVLLKLFYFGWDYQGLACQEDSNETIEYHLFNALTRTCLIASRDTSNYHRCGRTDKMVSAFCQVISIDLRSKFAPEQQLTPEALAAEIDYCGLLNRVLPNNIQCVAWMPLRCQEYSARFDCSTRTYRYYFPQGDLNIAAMQEGCKLLQRHADFRNFCKMDVHNGVTNYMRRLEQAQVLQCDAEQHDTKGYAMYYLEIKANAFLWHQIRCIMAILLLIGQGKEKPQVISDLLDVETNPCKPQYTPASGLPLNLFHCEFHARSQLSNSVHADTVGPADKDVTNELHVDTTTEEDHTTSWVFTEDNLQRLIETTQSEWTQHSVKCTMIRDVLQQLEATLYNKFQAATMVKGQVLLLQDGIKAKVYQQLLTRKRCESLENRIEHFVKKQRLQVRHNADEKAVQQKKEEEDLVEL